MQSIKSVVTLESLNGSINLFHNNNTFKMTYNYISDNELCLDFSMVSREITYLINYNARITALGLSPFCYIKGTEVNMVYFNLEEFSFTTGTESELYDLIDKSLNLVREHVLKIVQEEDNKTFLPSKE